MICRNQLKISICKSPQSSKQIIEGYNIKLFKCPFCGNSEPSSIGILNGKPYCRKCISFRGERAKNIFSVSKEATIYLTYPLSKEQEELSKKLVSNYKKGINSLVYAVTGSGKTEICLEVIKYCLNQRLKVGFAVPRRSVCGELKSRFQNYFRDNSVIAVFGGHHKRIEGDIVCLTTHQLFRYQHYFDLLILDEMDAFPFKGNDVLEHFFENAVKGNYVLLTATPSENVLKEFNKPGKDILRLPVRFHRHPLPVPKVINGSMIYLYYKLIRKIKEFIDRDEQVFVFVPTVDDSKKISLFLKLFFKSGTYINSKRNDNDSVIADFRDKKYMYLVTTAVLERGVTVKGLQVIVFKADHSIYDSASLIQIAGRAGRKIDAPEGEVIFFAKRTTKQIEKAICDINSNNQALQNLLQKDSN